MSDDYQPVPERPRIAYAVNMAARFLSENGVKSLPVHIFDIIRSIGWEIQTFTEVTHSSPDGYTIDELCEELGTTSGFSTLGSDGRYIIAYNDVSETKERTLFTVCHEVGHCFLKHFVNYDTANLSLEQMRVLDVEANTFAANLLIPVPIFDALRNEENTDNMYIFGVSKAAYDTRLLTIERDREMLNGENRIALNKLFHRFIYCCKCLNCNKLFTNDNHSDTCIHCGSSNIQWAFRSEYEQRKSERKERHVRKHKPREGALAHREERVRKLQEWEVWHDGTLEQKNWADHVNYISGLKAQPWSSLSEEEKIDLLDEKVLEEPNERDRKRNRSKSGTGHARKKTKVGNEEKTSDSKSRCGRVGVQPNPNRKDSE